MRVLVDVGNTFIKWALEDPAAPPGTSMQIGEPIRTEDGIEPLMRAAEDIAQPTSVFISSVGSREITRWLLNECVAAWSIRPVIVVVQKNAFGIRNRYSDPEQMGVDRWVALVAARELCPHDDVVVVDAGTAITVDSLSREGEFVGGLIMPGAALARRALLDRTARIDDGFEDRKDQLDPFGRDTGECVHHGAQFAAVGGVRAAISSVEQRFGRDVRLILCGGGADMLERHLGRPAQLEPQLVLHGLSIMSRRQSAVGDER